MMGVDLVKPRSMLEAAYNDSAEVTAEFNKNILKVVNREVGGSFDPANFEHLAFFNEEKSQVEMHLVARIDHRVTITGLGLDLTISAGERIHTEISRKFTHDSVESLLTEAGVRSETLVPL